MCCGRELVSWLYWVEVECGRGLYGRVLVGEDCVECVGEYGGVLVDGFFCEVGLI